ncbi:MAG: hypothetical protein JXN60_09020 [Lentisphaerae bacterium]|nr:hypothetical protein [Lentisphaerota bacterium]
MYSPHFMDIVNEIRMKDSRYSPDAYLFVREALDHTSKTLKKPSCGTGRHVTAQELLNGMRSYALQEFGPMALTVLKTWGIARTEDFGEIVFNLVEFEALGSTKEDKKEDFVHGYDFTDAFIKPFLPSKTARETTQPIRKTRAKSNTEKPDRGRTD